MHELVLLTSDDDEDLDIGRPGSISTLGKDMLESRLEGLELADEALVEQEVAGSAGKKSGPSNPECFGAINCCITAMM